MNIHASRQNGFSLPEALFAMLLAALALLATASYSIPWIAREKARGGAYEVQTYLRLARVEAVSRNRPCRFFIDPTARTFEVSDTQGTPFTTDDVVLHSSRLPTNVVLDRPDGGSDITLPTAGSGHEALLTPDGMVSGAAGAIHLFGGDRHVRISLYLAGGVHVDRWDGSAWVSEN